MVKSVDIRCRIEPELKERFQRQCERKSVNSSDLIRKYILDWTKKAEEQELKHIGKD